ncbi:hypothetical protein GBAR_LOCUS4325, partial [Geodia barretti]
HAHARTYKFSDVTKIRARPTFCYSNVRSNGSHKYAIHGPLSGAADTEAQGAPVGSQGERNERGSLLLLCSETRGKETGGLSADCCSMSVSIRRPRSSCHMTFTAIHSNTSTPSAWSWCPSVRTRWCVSLSHWLAL